MGARELELDGPRMLLDTHDFEEPQLCQCLFKGLCAAALKKEAVEVPLRSGFLCFVTNSWWASNSTHLAGYRVRRCAGVAPFHQLPNRPAACLVAQS